MFERKSQKIIRKHIHVHSEGVTVVIASFFPSYAHHCTILSHQMPTTLSCTTVCRVHPRRMLSIILRNVDNGSEITCFVHQELQFWVPFAVVLVSLNSSHEAMRSKFTFNINFCQTCPHSLCIVMRASCLPSTCQSVRNTSTYLS